MILQLKFIPQEQVSRSMKDDNSKFPSKHSYRESLQVCSSMRPLFSNKFKIHNIQKTKKQIINEIVQSAIR